MMKERLSVMVEKADFDLDAALAALAREAGAASPAPGPDLVARVLADAAEVSAGRRPAPARARPVARPVAGPLAGKAAGGGGRFGAFSGAISGAIFGWTTGAVACMALGLALGIGVGLEMNTGPLSIFDNSMQAETPLAALEPPLLAMESL